jgi:hypothetical protein
MIAYNLDYLYLIIESDADSITSRDRGYQNGDGFHLVIAKDDSGMRTREFYVLRFNPNSNSSNQPATKAYWYYNVDLSGKQLSKNTLFSSSSLNGKSYFELLLPWDEVYPYHPIFNEEIGINLCFVKAIGAYDKNYYFLKKDPYIQW